MKNINYVTLCEGFEKLNDKRIYTFIDSPNNEIKVTGFEFKERVRKILFYLQSMGIKQGDELVFQIKSNLEFTYVFWACVLGKIIPIPFTYIEADRDQFKILKIWNSLNNPYLVTDIKSLKKVERVIGGNNANEYEKIRDRAVLIENMLDLNEKAEIVYSDATDIAFVQFSSGSTNDPKGVIITHKNIISSINATLSAMQVQENDIYLSWLPLTHSFGLIGTYLTPLLAECEFYIMPSNLFVTNPLLWIEKLSEHKVTITASPNFGLKRVCKYFYSKKSLQIDLSSLRIILDGAEPVSADVCTEFAEKMSKFGMKSTAICPSYGLSEATLVVSTPKTVRDFEIVQTLREQVRVGGEIIESNNKSNNTISFVDVGEILDNFETKIVDEDYNTVGELVVGSLFLKGEAIFTEYYNNPEATKLVLAKDGWFNTGDLGFMKGNKLVLTGRAKDIIFVNGENYYTYDIERICEEVEDISKVAVCGACNELKQDQLICFVEFRGNSEKFKDISAKIKRQVVQKIGIGITCMIPVDEIPVTVSGKIKRYLLLEQFNQGKFKTILDTL